MAIDGQGRLWASTEWGLNVFDGKTWTQYQKRPFRSICSKKTVYSVCGGCQRIPGTD
jgi:ligand-binding sensor domain-containing protein